MTLFVMDTKTLQKSFGLRCKELRAGLGCSQEQFANLIEMDRSYYASIEVGRRNVSLSNLKKIADGFQISIAELMRGVSQIYPSHSSQWVSLISALRKWKSSQRTIVNRPNKLPSIVPISNRYLSQRRR